jgi:hypothetical protein
MKKYKQILPVLAAIVISMAFTGCKKGEDDPVLSLQSRKARVAGEWKITKMEGTSSSTFSGSATHCTETFDGSTYTKTCGTGTPDVISGAWTFDFKRDGTFTSHLDFTDEGDRSIWDFEGTWTFLCGVVDKKNKEQLGITFTKLTSVLSSSGGSSVSAMWSGKERAYTVWDIKQLKSKEMVWYLKTANSNINSSTESESTVTLTQN